MLTADDKQSFIREKAAEHRSDSNEKIWWSLHAVKKLRQDKLRKQEVEMAFKSCFVIEDYGVVEGRPLPSCLVLGFIADEPIHAVLAIDKDFDRIFIITIYRPSRERWQDDWRNRKS